MDKVRLGRALGYGTRHAAKTLAAVAEAAAAPDPAPSAQKPPPTVAPPTRTVRDAAPPQPPPAWRPSVAQVRGEHIRGAGKSFWGPLATFSGALWLRVTGLFFALIAFAMLNGAWRLRGVARHGGPTSAEQARHFWVFLAFAVLFGYFTATSFVRARLRERRAAAR